MFPIYNAAEPVVFQAPYTGYYSKKKDSQGKQLGAKLDEGRYQLIQQQSIILCPRLRQSWVGLPQNRSLNPHFHLKKRKQSGTTNDPNSSQPLTSTHVVDGMHKEVQEATSTSLNFLVDKTKSARDGLESVHTKTGTDKEDSRAKKDGIFNQDEFNNSLKLTSSKDAKEIKIEDLSKLVKDVGIDLIDLDSLEDDTPVIVEDDEDEEVHAKLLALPGQVFSIITQLLKLKVLDALSSLLIKATEALNRFATAIASTSQKMVILVFIQQAKLALIMSRGRRTYNKSQSLSYSNEEL
nr:hypothetical protein [Tanacetum cinerariifolium]